MPPLKTWQTALGTLATEEVLRRVAGRAVFREFKRVAETPFNRVFQAR